MEQLKEKAARYIELKQQEKKIKKELEKLNHEIKETFLKEKIKSAHNLTINESVKINTDYKNFLKDNDLTVPEKYISLSGYYTLNIDY